MSMQIVCEKCLNARIAPFDSFSGSLCSKRRTRFGKRYRQVRSLDPPASTDPRDYLRTTLPTNAFTGHDARSPNFVERCPIVNRSPDAIGRHPCAPHGSFLLRPTFWHRCLRLRPAQSYASTCSSSPNNRCHDCSSLGNSGPTPTISGRIFGFATIRGNARARAARASGLKS
jgi:hypothetical protein